MNQDLHFATDEDEARYFARNRSRRGRSHPPDCETPTPQPLPHSREVEACFLSCCFVDGGEVVAKAFAAGVRESSFYFSTHAAIWRALEKLWHQRASLSDCVVAIAEELKAAGDLEACGGYAFLNELVGLVATTAQAAALTEQVLKYAWKRAAIREARRLAELAARETVDEIELRAPLDQLVALRSHTDRDLPAIVSGGKFAKLELPEPPWVIERVVHRGEVVLTAAPSKGHKTWLALDQSISMAAGVGWLGFKCSATRVLHIDLELAQWALLDRARQIAKARSIEIPEGIDWWSLRGYARPIDELLPLIAARAPVGQYGAIMLEPSYVLLGGRDENDNGDVTDYFVKLSWLARMTGAAVFTTHHYAKGDASKKDVKDRASGAGAWMRAPDVAMLLSQLSEEQGENAFVLNFIERHVQQVASLGLRWEFPLMRLTSGLDLNALREPGRPKESTEDDVVKLLGDEMLSHGQWLRLAERRGLSERTFNRRLKAALTSGLVVRCGEYYQRPKGTS